MSLTVDPEELVYIVDDDPAVLSSLSGLLSAAQKRVKSFRSPETFLQDIENNQELACAIIDLRMPGMSGIEVLRKISDLSLPTIILTGHGNIATGVTAIKEGAISFLEKPCSPAVLLANVEEALEQSRRIAERRSARKQTAQRLSLLTAGERETLELLVAGNSNKEIAERLNVCLRTVQARRTSTMEKLGTPTIEALISMIVHYRESDQRNEPH